VGLDGLVLFDVVCEGCWFVCVFGPVWHRRCFAEFVELKSGCRDGGHDRSIVEDFAGDVLFFAFED